MSRRNIRTIANSLAESDANHAELLLNNTELEEGDSVVKALKILSDTVEDLINNDTDLNTAVSANTAKTGITTAQANAITANTAKTGITSSQANAITANTAKVGFTTTMPTATEDHSIRFTVENDGRGNYTLIISVVDQTNRDRPVIKTAEITLR